MSAASGGMGNGGEQGGGGGRKVFSVPTVVILAALGGALLAINLFWLSAPEWDRTRYFFWLFHAQTGIHLLACFLVIRADPGRWALPIVVVCAALLRLTLVPTEPQLSTDVYRYVWDGAVQAAGVNPYRHVPAAPELAHLRDDYIYERVNRRDYAHTAYPPAAQLVFLLSALIRPRGLTTLKLIFVLCELVTVGALVALLGRLGLNPARAVVYAWSPLAFWETAQNGHVEALAVMFVALAALAAARGRRATTGVLLALAALVKVYPGLLAAAFYRKWDWRLPAAMAATAAIFYLPYLGAGGEVLGFLTHYPREEGFASGERFLLLKWIQRLGPLPTRAYLALAALALGAVVAYLVAREKSVAEQLRGATLIAGLALLLGSPQYAWYYLWLLPLLGATIERVRVGQLAAGLAVLAAFARHHLAGRLTPDLLAAPLLAGASLAREPAAQWWWLVLVASAGFLSWL